MSKKLFVIPFLFSLLLAFGSEAFANSPTQNERFVIRSLRTIGSAQATYAASTGNGNYGTLQNLGQANFIDSVLAEGLKYGYIYEIRRVLNTGTTPSSFYAAARPVSYRKTGRKSFYIDESGVTRGADRGGASATANDPIVENDCFPNEECTIADLRGLFGAQNTYRGIGNENYGSLSELYAIGLIPAGLAGGLFHGYAFVCTVAPRTNNSDSTFKITAVPINYGATGVRSFYLDESGIIRGADKNGAPADANDPPI
ncbi:MAG: hypothetical protein LH614_03010 [Pyrinomonadaceae bacterium]|nr:hypothetical protein [Pyrinomonadaceae bacterium]